MSETWLRPVECADGAEHTFASVANGRGHCFYYCPLVCTELGGTTIADLCPELHLCPAHLLPREYGALEVDSVVWPDELRPRAREFVYTASRRAGIPDNQWQGFHNLGLAIAFEHCVPDATLPIFYHSSSTWNPLVIRS